MTTMRSVEPLTGADKFIVWLFPILAPSEPEPGEHGVDRHMRVYIYHPETGWTPDLPWWGALPGLGAKAEEQWQASGEAEAG